MSNSALKTQVKVQQLELERNRNEISRLKIALRALLNEGERHEIPEETSEDMDTDEVEDEDLAMDEDEMEEETESTQPEELPIPIFDGSLSYCSECCFELEIEGDACLCSKCGTEHSWDPDTYNPDSEDIVEPLTESPDRSLVPRGNTPLLEIEGLDREDTPFMYCNYNAYLTPEKRDHYQALRKRGATRFMCETFHLEFSYKKGIYAWADDDLYDDFSGPAMKKGDSWKIHLGRRIMLDKDDLDGSVFIETLLEEASNDIYKWQTKEETRGIWVTRLRNENEIYPMDSDYDLEDDFSWAQHNGTLPDPSARTSEAIIQNEYDLSQDDPNITAYDRENPWTIVPILDPDAHWDSGSEDDETKDDTPHADGGGEQSIAHVAEGEVVGVTSRVVTGNESFAQAISGETASRVDDSASVGSDSTDFDEEWGYSTS